MGGSGTGHSLHCFACFGTLRTLSLDKNPTLRGGETVQQQSCSDFRAGETTRLTLRLLPLQ
jgi:hypothetical protein